jgi:GT2 family glycosyltransferase
LTDIIDYIYQRGKHAKKKAPSGRGIHVVITTYNRPRELRRLLGDIIRVRGNLEVTVQVYDDASTEDYSAPIALIKQQGWHYVKAKARHGKQNSWRWISRIFSDQRKVKSRYWVFLPDDVRLGEGMFRRALERWRGIEDTHKICMMLVVGETRTGPSWTGVQPQRCGEVDRIQWVELACLCERRMLDVLEYKLAAVPAARWQANPKISSGVGEQLSRRLHGAGFGLYRSHKSLIVHLGELPSQLNPNRGHTMNTIRFIDGAAAQAALASPDSVEASVASIHYRGRLLSRVVDRIGPQVDRVNVYLDGYSEIPAALNRPWVRFIRSRKVGDPGDAGKFWWATEQRGYHLTIDDDIAYPVDYAYRLLTAIERYDRKAIVGLHGSLIEDTSKGYYGGRRTFHCFGALDRDVGVHMLGTGTVAYHAARMKVSIADFRAPNMADCWFAQLAQRHRVAMVAVARRERWLSALPDPGATIWDRFRGQALRQDEILRSTAWRVIEVGAKCAPARRKKKGRARRRGGGPPPAPILVQGSGGRVTSGRPSVSTKAKGDKHLPPIGTFGKRGWPWSSER